MSALDSLFALGYKAVADIMMRPVPAAPPMQEIHAERVFPKTVGLPVHRYILRYHTNDLDCVETTAAEAQIIKQCDRRVASIVKLADEPPFTMDRDELVFDLCAS